MLVAKINPPAKRVVQKSPFTTQEFTAEYMIAKCNKLVIGAVPGSFNDKTEFAVKFGSIKYEKNPDGTDTKPLLEVVVTTNVNFTQAELSNWGTDDSVVYTLIAQKLGFEIISTEVMDMQFTY